MNTTRSPNLGTVLGKHSDGEGWERRLSLRRRWAAGMVVLAIMVVGGRLIFVQGIRSARFAASARRQHLFTEPLPSHPGEILDRHGRVLAASILTRSLWVNPSEIRNSRSLADKLAPVLRIDSQKLFAKLTNAKERQFLWIKRRLTAEEAAAVRKLELRPELWGFRDEYIRKYPQGSIAAHLLGLRDVDGNGQGGIEQAFDRLLRGSPGRRVALRDARGRIVEIFDNDSRLPKHGRSVQLTIDVVLQLDAEREIDALMQKWKPSSAGIIVMDPKNGEILAMASRPAFDPNNPQNVPDAAWKNVNIATVFEPGSTFKPFVVAWALHKQAITRDEIFYCERGKYRMGRRLLHDHHPYGKLSVLNILVKSSNIGMAKIGERMTNKELYAAAVRFGFGRKTGCGLPGEIAGILRPLRKWNGYSTGSIPMGQEIGVTPLQLITAHAALANGGRLISPRLVRRIGESVRSAGGSRSEETPPSVVSQTVDPEVADWLVRVAMVDVVRRGTGKSARLRGYEVFGKTGTAQKIDVRTGRYSRKHHVCSFVCGAPARSPRVLVLVVVDSPTQPGVHFGGTVAAPTAAKVLEKALLHLGVPVNVAAAKK